jgi:hypothetical protein
MISLNATDACMSTAGPEADAVRGRATGGAPAGGAGGAGGGAGGVALPLGGTPILIGGNASPLVMVTVGPLTAVPEAISTFN